MYVCVHFLVAVLVSMARVSLAHYPMLMPTYKWWPGVRWDAGLGDDTEVVYLPALLPREPQLADDNFTPDEPLSYNFDAFGRNFKLRLVPNRRLVAPQFRVWSEEGAETTLSGIDSSCHYLHTGPDTVAALSACRDHALHGLILVDNSTYEVRPLDVGTARVEDMPGRTAHVIRRATPPAPPGDDARPLRPRLRKPRARPIKYKDPPNYTIEIALFIDEAAYKIFHPFLNYNEADLRDMLLAYINGVQALYHHSSLGARIQLSLVRLTLLRTQPTGLPPHAERGRLLDSFCAYQKSLNIEDDNDPDHWDMALLLSGLDFYADEGGRRNGVTMGLAPVGGMHHDGTGNSCARDGFIMSPSRGTNGEATWSTCSAQVVADLQWATCLFDGDDSDSIPPELNHERFADAPGAVVGAKRQCEVFLRDGDAAPTSAVPVSSLCAQLTCRTPHRAGFYYAGPALPGTPCGPRKWCQGGECVHGGKIPDRAPGVDGGGSLASVGWSPWEEGACRSGCTLRSRGTREKRRQCSQTDACHGTGYDVVLCDDIKVCGKKTRVGANELASRKCAEYATLLSELDPRGGGLQAPHDPTRMWMGCAVFCRRAAGGGFYAPRVELNDVGMDPYFPDGTWCHYDGTNNYYCLQHHCLPENFKMTAQYHIWELPGEDISGAFNARARATNDDTDSLRAYFTIDDNGTPILRSAFPPQLPADNEHDWEVIDYVDIPKS